MIQLNVVLDGLAAVDGKLDNLSASVRKAVYLKILSLTLMLEARVKAKLSGDVLNVRSGALRRSIQNDVKQAADIITGKVYSAGDVKYARIHEFGGKTPPHIIEARHAKSLAFMVGGKQMFAKRVNHPGSKMPERSYMRSSLREMAKEIQDDLQAAVATGIADA